MGLGTMDLETDLSWQAIVSAALVGTERQPFQPPIATGKLGLLLTDLSNKSPEAALLSAAAVLALYQQAGWLPANRPATLEPCPPDNLPRCGSRAAQLLQQMLEGKYPQVLSEWLTMAAIAQQHVPELYLPKLLDLGKQQRGWRSAILPVLGQRGRWLAAQNPDWSYAVELTSTEDWETGSQAARLLYLQQLRAIDPDQPRSLLMATWSQEAAGDRAKFLDTLRIGLSLADETFLEDALDDRSKEVRRLAAGLLASLPTSQLCQRMAERLKTLVKVKLVNGRATDFQVVLPETCDADMQRDGIEAKQPLLAIDRTIGERSGWLLQIVGATPLQFWEDLGGINAQAWLELAQNHEWQEVFAGWEIAIKRQRHPQWTWAFLGFKDVSGMAEAELMQLLAVLTPEQRIEFAKKLLFTPTKTLEKQPIWNLVLVMMQYRDAFRDQLTRAVLARLQQYWAESDKVKFDGAEQWQLRQVISTLAFCIDPKFLPEVTAMRPEESKSPLAVALEEFLTILQFRQDVLKAFGVE
jgi:hypothetical protein